MTAARPSPRSTSSPPPRSTRSPAPASCRGRGRPRTPTAPGSCASPSVTTSCPTYDATTASRTAPSRPPAPSARTPPARWSPGPGVPIGTLCIFDPEEKEVDPEHDEGASRSCPGPPPTSSRPDGATTRSRARSSTLTDRQRELRRSNEHLAAFAGTGQPRHPGTARHRGDGSPDARPRTSTRTRVPVPEHRRMFLRNALSGAQRMRTHGDGTDGLRRRGRQPSRRCGWT